MTARPPELVPVPADRAAALAGALVSLGGEAAGAEKRTGDSLALIAVASVPKVGDVLAVVDADLARVVEGQGQDEGQDGAALELKSAPMRRRLGNRRAHWTVEFEHAGIRYTAGVGRFADDPGADLAEVFFNVPGKAGTPLESHVRDEAIAASLALQHGCPADTLRAALTRNVDGSPSGALGRLLEILETEGGAP
jgi:ribonucleoside-diphosphate reductase alpha chain